jgi:hypothetical protein
MKRLQDNLALPEEVRTGLQKRALGQDLIGVTELPGYEVVLDILRSDIESAAKKLRTYKESNPNEAMRMLAELQGKEKALTNLESKVKYLTALVESPPENIQDYINH